MGFANRIATALKVLAGYHLQEYGTSRTQYVRESGSARVDIPYGVRRKMLSWAREMERKDPIFNAFLDLCERYVIGPNGLRIVSGSEDLNWASLANAEWDAWQPYCDVSSRFSFGQRQGLIEREVEVAGECFIYLTYSSASSRPRIQLIESENVETPPSMANDTTIVDGIRLDENDSPIGYFVRQRDGKTFREIPSESMVHIMEPSRIGQVRGLSIIYPVLDCMIDLRESIDLEMLAHKDAAETSKVINNALGEAPQTDLRRQKITGVTQKADGSAVAQDRLDYFQQKLGGRTVILKNGEKYEQFQNTRPGDAVQKFWDFVAAREAAGMGLPIEIMVMRSLQGTMTRAALDMANAFFRCRSASRAESFNLVWQHVMANTVTLRKGQPRDWRKTRYTPPRSINVDVGRNSNALIAEWKAGFRTLEGIAGELGQDWKEVLRQRVYELRTAMELEKQNGLPPGTLLEIETLQQQEQPQLSEPAPSNRLVFNKA